MKLLQGYLKRAIEELDNLPPQEGYPNVVDRTYHGPPIPEPIGYVYHVSPYAKEILEQGFKIDPTKSTLGTFGGSDFVSTTDYNNALHYKQGIQTVVGAANGEIGLEELLNMVNADSAKTALKHVIGEDFYSWWNSYLDKYGEAPIKFLPPGYEKWQEKFDEESKEFYRYVEELRARGPEDVTDEEHAAVREWRQELLNKKPVKQFFESDIAYNWFRDLALDRIDFEGKPISEEEEGNRRWRVLNAVSLITNVIPYVIGSEIPEHLKNRKMSDVGIVEVAVAPAEYEGTSFNPTTEAQARERAERNKREMEESGKFTPEEIEESYQFWLGTVNEPKGKYTYNMGEKEWRFFDVTDLWPIRLVGNLRYIPPTRKQIVAAFHRNSLERLLTI